MIKCPFFVLPNPFVQAGSEETLLIQIQINRSILLIYLQILRGYLLLYNGFILISSQQGEWKIIAVKIYRVPGAGREDKAGAVTGKKFPVMIIRRRKSLAIFAPSCIVFFKTRIVGKGLVGIHHSCARKEKQSDKYSNTIFE